MPSRKAHLPALCHAVGNALDRSGFTKRELAQHLGVDPSVVTRMVSSTVPDVDVVLKIERFLGLPKGKLFVEAGIVDLPVMPEELIRLDRRLPAPWARLAEVQLRACIEGAAEESKEAASRAQRPISSSISA